MSSSNEFLVSNVPYISPENSLRAVSVNQNSISLIGSMISSTDTYAVVGLLKDGVRISQFTRIQSEGNDDNVTLGNLAAGSIYTVELVSVIGTNTNCGESNSTDSAIVPLEICTGK